MLVARRVDDNVFRSSTYMSYYSKTGLRYIRASSPQGSLVGLRMCLGQSRLEEHTRRYRAAQQTTREQGKLRENGKEHWSNGELSDDARTGSRGAASWRFAPMVATASWHGFMAVLEHSTGLARWAEFYDHFSDHFDHPLDVCCPHVLLCAVM